MKNLSLKKYLNEKSQINESLTVGALLCAGFIAHCVVESTKSDGGKAFWGGIGGFFAGVGGAIGSLFGYHPEKEDKDEKDKKDKKDKKKRDDDDDETPNKRGNSSNSNNWNNGKGDHTGGNDEKDDNSTPKIQGDATSTTDPKKTPVDSKKHFAAAMLALQKMNSNVKDEEEREVNQRNMNILTMTCMDENGNMIPPADRKKRLEDIVGKENADEYLKKMDKLSKKVDDKEAIKNIQKSLKEVATGITQDEVEKVDDYIGGQAANLYKQLNENKKEVEKLEKELNDLDKNSPEYENKKKELEDKIANLKKNTIPAKAVNGGAATPKPQGDPEPKPQGDPEPKPQGDPKPKPQGDPEPKPQDEEVSQEEIDGATLTDEDKTYITNAVNSDTKPEPPEKIKKRKSERGTGMVYVYVGKGHDGQEQYADEAAFKSYKSRMKAYQQALQQWTAKHKSPAEGLVVSFKNYIIERCK